MRQCVCVRTYICVAEKQYGFIRCPRRPAALPTACGRFLSPTLVSRSLPNTSRAETYYFGGNTLRPLSIHIPNIHASGRCVFSAESDAGARGIFRTSRDLTSLLCETSQRRLAPRSGAELALMILTQGLPPAGGEGLASSSTSAAALIVFPPTLIPVC